MLKVALVILLCIQSTVVIVDSARILGVFPIPSLSHQVVFRALMLELAKRGHEVVIITPNPALPKDRPPDNVTEIDTSEIYQVVVKLYEDMGKHLTRGVVTSLDMLLTGQAKRSATHLVAQQFEMPKVKELLEDKSQKFDLVFSEVIGNYHLIAGHIFKAPVIWFSSFFGYPHHFQEMGSFIWHPELYPHFYRHKYRNLTFWEKIKEIYVEWKILRVIQESEEYDNKILKQQFGPDTPSVEELKKNVQMMFVNSHPLFGSNRPVPPSVIHLGAIHLQPVKELPQDLKSYLDKSHRGVVYVSFGTNVRPTMMDKDLLDALLNAFGQLPYDVLWKFDGDNIQVPKNVQTQKWFPQRDLLMHPNIKVFVTQGGLQSTDEAIDAGVPLVGVPMLGDQWYNVNKFVELGIGEHIDAVTLTSQEVVDKITKVINDESYRKNIRKLRDLVNDQPQTPLERAVWWTEHVLRHNTTAHLQAPSAHVTLSEYLMCDILLPVLSIVLVTLILVLVICCYVRKLFKNDVKLKKS